MGTVVKVASGDILLTSLQQRLALHGASSTYDSSMSIETPYHTTISSGRLFFSYSAVQAQLTNVQQVQATRYAFAAIRGAGSVAMLDMVGTAVLFKFSSRTYNRSRPLGTRVLPFWAMGLL